MARCFLDHITVTAHTLESGAAFVREVLGVALQAGGEHPRMATHNLLLRLGDALFLEVIAPIPLLPPPARPRWFGLDRLGPESAPALSTWVVRTGDIRAAVAACPEPLGEIEPMSRGSLEWLITIPADGSIPLDGVGPALIEWHTERHPAAGLEDKGLSLARLEIRHPQPERLARLLHSLGLDAPVSLSATHPGESPGLVAHIDTPAGARLLSALAVATPCVPAGAGRDRPAG